MANAKGTKGAAPNNNNNGQKKGQASKPIVDVDSIDFNKKILHGPSTIFFSGRSDLDLDACTDLLNSFVAP